ncbi:YqgE/AlgH family protein [Shewanella sp.]|nr:YqgE/AlgH family protein [Shewanella sp.]
MDSLKNHFIIAMPSLNDTFFERSLLYICDHDEKGAMGIMINRPSGIIVDELLLQMELNEQPQPVTSLGKDVLIGGPVNPEQGFVLHTHQNGWDHSEALSDNLMLTTSQDLLGSLGSDKAPTKFLIALGYAGWGRGQLEQEIIDNAWLSVPATTEILFDLEHAQRWQYAAESLGFDIWQLSNLAGHG